VVGLVLAVTLGDELVHHVGHALAPNIRALGGQIDPDMLESLGQQPGIDQVYSAGTSRRLVRLPAAPKMTIAHGGATGTRLSSSVALPTSLR